MKRFIALALVSCFLANPVCAQDGLLARLDKLEANNKAIADAVTSHGQLVKETSQKVMNLQDVVYSVQDDVKAMRGETKAILDTLNARKNSLFTGTQTPLPPPVVLPGEVKRTVSWGSAAPARQTTMMMSSSSSSACANGSCGAGMMGGRGLFGASRTRSVARMRTRN